MKKNEIKIFLIRDFCQQWFCELIDESTGEIAKVIDLGPAGVPLNNDLLFIPAKFLPYGLYRFTIHVELGSRGMFTAKQTTYVRVVKSPLVAMIVPNGMTEIVRGYDQNVTLSPELYSYDPDLERTEQQVC